MTTPQSDNAIMLGGPRDGELFTAPDSALVEHEIDGLTHRYIRTTASRENDGRELTVFNYDGAVR